MLCVVCKLVELSGRQKSYCSKNCERKGWRDNNHQKILEGKRNYRENNKAKIAIYHKAYKAKVKHIKDKLAKQLKEAYPCLRCGTNELLEVHHIKSQLIGGGPNDLNNIIVLCKTCHALWHKLFPKEYWEYGIKQ